MREMLLEQFWTHFQSQLSLNMPDKSNVSRYYDTIFLLLLQNKERDLSSNDSASFQFEIEKLTMYFDEESFYKTSPNLLQVLIRSDGISAKEYLKGHLASEYLPLFENFATYTLEAIMIHALGIVFSCVNDSPVVRLSTLIDKIDSIVRVHAYIQGYQNTDLDDGVKRDKRKGKVNRKHYAIGVHLVQFLVERELIVLSTDLSFTEGVSQNQKGYYPLNCYAMCNFDFNLLPIKLNLPMVHKPLDWFLNDRYPSGIISLSDIRGGYLSGHMAFTYNRFRVLTSRNHDSFNILLTHKEFDETCSILNGLQSQPFEISAVRKTPLF